MGTEADGAATPLAEPLAVSLLVARLLDGLGVRYLVGGSVASSLLGLPRATLDSDMVADLDIAHAAPLVAALGDGFYADEDAIRDAIRRRSSFNVIHLATAFKVDVFVLRRDPYSASEMDRRVSVVVGPSPSHTLWVATAEDMVLQKLDRFRRGGGVSASRRSAQWSAASEALRPRSGVDATRGLDPLAVDPAAAFVEQHRDGAADVIGQADARRVRRPGTGS